MLKTKSVKINMLLNVMLSITTLLFPLITFPYASKVLTPVGIGKVSFANSFISYFSIFALLGVSTYGVKACAQVRDDKEKLSKTVHEILVILLTTTAVAYVALGICIFTIDKLRAEKTLFILLSSYIFLTTIGIGWLFAAVEDYLYITIKGILFNLLSLILLFIFVKDEGDYLIYGGISIVSSVGSNLLNLLYSRKYISYKRQKNYNFKQHVKPLIVLFGMAAINQINLELGKTMLGFMVDDNDFTVGIFETSMKFYRILMSVCTAASSVLLPRLSYYIKNGEKEKFKETLQQILSFMLIFSIPVAIYFVIMARDCIMFLAGAQYELSIMPMRIATLSIIFLSLTNIIGVQMLIPTGEEKKVVVSVAIGAFVNAILNLLLIKHFLLRGNGAIASAIATLCAECSVFIVEIILARRHLKDIFNKIKWWRILLIDALFFGVAFGSSFINFNIESTRTLAFVRLAVTAVICAVAYVMILWVCKEPMLREIISSITNKFKKKQVAVTSDNGDGAIDGKDVVVEQLNGQNAINDETRDSVVDDTQQNSQDQNVAKSE